ncbi:MAG: hypothetical protein KAH95_05325, partial [Spirochaetales bacterium]|nr:hypothetical protein [Spirochaetales bacterium]
MIPIATELGEHGTANNLRDILVEFEYKAMTPDEIAASELQSLIDESRGYLISKLKVLRNYLNTEQYDEVESMWNMTLENWNELIGLGYDTDSDSEIKNLWAEIKPMLSKVPGITGDTSPGENNQTNTGNSNFAVMKSEKDNFIRYMQSGNFNKAKSAYVKVRYLSRIIDYNNLTPEDINLMDSFSRDMDRALENNNMDGDDLDNYDSFKGNPYGSEAKAKFLQYMYSLLEAGENRNKNLSESITVQFSKYLYEVEAKGLIWTDMEKDTTLKAEMDALERRMDELDRQKQEEYDPEESDQTPGGSGYSTGTSNSSF